ncbi:hypothetical protein I8752_11990 [Nostocaceae cyanobacterium CENA369]|uniref:Uncharacterized protein n=1 Tax=Dendronalium phyllosphericum CENA369 TaxID=1725256 RepID=A0A8J7I612_9NOST|nr:hypothetical protein [Dendronalium phyllosphericum]MBH8573726.1 hypothetical protein [Dendronalium phyllosphericum CENA369]
MEHKPHLFKTLGFVGVQAPSNAVFPYTLHPTPCTPHPVSDPTLSLFAIAAVHEYELWSW